MAAPEVASYRRGRPTKGDAFRSEEHTSELQSPYVISYAVFCLKKKSYRVLHPGRRWWTKRNHDGPRRRDLVYRERRRQNRTIRSSYFFLKRCGPPHISTLSPTIPSVI